MTFNITDQGWRIIMNLVVLNGRLTAKPELKISASGKEYCQFTLAIRKFYKKDDKNATDFVDCVAYGNLARYIATNSGFDKGKPMLVKEGTIYTKSQDILGKKFNLMQVVVLSVEYNLSDSSKNAEQDVSGGSRNKKENDNVSRRRLSPDRNNGRLPRSKPLTSEE